MNLSVTTLSLIDIQDIIRQELALFFNRVSEKKQSTNNLLTIDQAAKFLHISKSTIYSKVAQMEIPYSKKGKRLYFDENDLKNWVLEGKELTRKEIFIKYTNTTLPVEKGANNVL